MMRSAFDHPKLRRLCQLLQVPQYVAVGILESIWHFTARYAPQGNIGKFPDEDIASWIGYPCPDMTSLVSALVDAGWMDRCSASRLVIHDWHVHADQAVHRLLKRNKLEFLSSHVQSCPVMTKSPVPVTKPVPVPEPVPTSCAEPDEPPPAPAVFELTLIPKDGTYGVTQALVDEWAEAYPGVNVLGELRKADQWCKANPTRRKTAAGARRFLNGWLSRAQNASKGRALPEQGSFDEIHDQRRREQEEQFARERAEAARMAEEAGKSAGGK